MNEIIKDIIKKLDDLHDTRRQMSHASIYHGSYQEKAIELNKQLEELTGFSYVEHKEKERRGKIW